MKRFIYILLLFYLSTGELISQSVRHRDSVRTLGGLIIKTRQKELWNVYDPERGFFQKAFTDKGDPRFMIANEDESFKFGIGGFVNVIPLLDFNGMVENRDFVTSEIPVPNRAKGQFALGAESSRVNFKAVGKTKHGDIIAFLETDFRGASNTLRIRHAYISYFGFTVGQTWSTFMDLEAGPPTIDMEGPNTQINLRQPMIRYSYFLRNRWSFSLAMEMNTTLQNDYSGFGIREEYQRFPDFPLQIRYKDRFGHLQLAAILRVMNYYDDTLSFKSISQTGFGIALSGKVNLGSRNFLFFQSVYGQGIARYIQDLSFTRLDLVPDLNRPGRLRTFPMYGGYIALRHNWTQSLYSGLIYSFTILDPPKEYEFPGLFAHTHYFAVNLFWDFIPYGTMGIEYLFGQRVNQNGQSASANRIDLMFRYGF